MHKRATWIMAGLVAVLACTGIASAQAADHPVQAQLLADTKTIAPGTPFRVGLLLTMRHEWHTYWLNPGDAGQATSLALSVPPGFIARPLAFPVPIKFTQTGGIVGYGYEDQVLLIATVIPPHDLPQSEQTITGQARWLVCNPETCVPGSADLSLSLAVGSAAEPANRELFDKWSALLPAKAEKAGATVRWTGSGDVASPGGLVLGADVGFMAPVTAVEFYPPAAPAIQVEAIDVQARPQGARITLTIKRLAGQSLDETSLPAVVGYTDANGQRRGVAVDVPLSAAAGSASAQP
jgi:thiol:disulfide interchange protein DsbD